MLEKLFSKNRNKKIKKIKNIIAIQSGEVVDIADIEDVMFDEKVLGDGVALIPEKGEIHSPVSGIIDVIANTLHAYGIKTDDGVDILVHVGLETVELQGEGFDPKVKVGDRVEMGDLLTIVDLKLIEEKGFSKTTPIIITNVEDLQEMKTFKGQAIKKETVIIEYKK